MKKLLKNKKNWILSLSLAFMLFLGVGASIPLKSVSAFTTSTNILDYEWANYWNMFPDSMYFEGDILETSSTVPNSSSYSVSYDEFHGQSYPYLIPTKLIKPSTSLSFYHALDILLLSDTSTDHIYPAFLHSSIYDSLPFSFTQEYSFGNSGIFARVMTFLVLYDTSVADISDGIYYKYNVERSFSFPTASDIRSRYGEDINTIGVALSYVIDFSSYSANLSLFSGEVSFDSRLWLNCSQFKYTYSPYFYSSNFLTFPEGNLYNPTPLITGIPRLDLPSYIDSISSEAYIEGYSEGRSEGYSWGYEYGEIKGVGL